MDIALKDLCLFAGIGCGVASQVFQFLAFRRMHSSEARAWFMPLYWQPRSEFTAPGWRYRQYGKLLLSAAVILIGVSAFVLQ